MNKFTLRSIGHLYFLSFLYLVRKWGKAYKVSAKEDKTVELTISVASLQDALKEIENNIKKRAKYQTFF